MTDMTAAISVTPPAMPSKRERKYLIALSMLVLLPGLGISAWSFYGYARSANAPILLAGSASAAIDGIGLFAAYFAARFTNRGQSARFPRLVTYVMIAASVYINWAHASAQKWSPGLHAFVSAPAVASAFAFEILMLELRVNERAKREQRRRSRMSAKVDTDLWLHHPFAVWGARRWESRDRLAELFPGLGAGSLARDARAASAVANPEPLAPTAKAANANANATLATTPTPTANPASANPASANIAVANGIANTAVANPARPTTPTRPRPVANPGGDTSTTDSLIAAMEPAYRQLLATTGRRPTAGQLVEAVDGINTESRAKQIRDALEARFPELAPRLRAVS